MDVWIQMFLYFFAGGFLQVRMLLVSNLLHWRVYSEHRSTFYTWNSYLMELCCYGRGNHLPWGQNFETIFVVCLSNSKVNVFPSCKNRKFTKENQNRKISITYSDVRNNNKIKKQFAKSNILILFFSSSKLSPTAKRIYVLWFIYDIW